MNKNTSKEIYAAPEVVAEKNSVWDRLGLTDCVENMNQAHNDIMKRVTALRNVIAETEMKLNGIIPDTDKMKNMNGDVFNPDKIRNNGNRIDKDLMASDLFCFRSMLTRSNFYDLDYRNSTKAFIETAAPVLLKEHKRLSDEYALAKNELEKLMIEQNRIVNEKHAAIQEFEAAVTKEVYKKFCYANDCGDYSIVGKEPLLPFFTHSHPSQILVLYKNKIDEMENEIDGKDIDYKSAAASQYRRQSSGLVDKFVAVFRR